MSVAKYSEAGDATQPSPSIWRDCRMSLLNDLGLGKYAAYNGMGANTGIAGAGELEAVIGDFEMTADSEIVLSNALVAGEEGGRIDLQVPASDNAAIQVHTGVGPGFVLNSGNKVWFEARVALGAAADQAAFFGLVEEDAIADVLADNAAAVIGQSMFGFQVLNGDTDDIDAMAKLDAVTTIVLVDNVTRSTAFTTAGGTSKQYPVADLYTKFGLRFGGQDTLEYYVDGYLVHTLTIVNGTHADGVALAPMVAFKVGTATAGSINISFMRYAHQIRT